MSDILKERQATHGDYKNTSVTAQHIKGLIRGGESYPELILAQRESLDMIATKIARIVSGDPNEIDHWEDIAGYANLIVRELKEDE